MGANFITVSVRGEHRDVLLASPFLLPRGTEDGIGCAVASGRGLFVRSQRILVIVQCNNGHGIENEVRLAVITIIIIITMCLVQYKDLGSHPPLFKSKLRSLLAV